MADTTANVPSVSPLPLWDLAHAYCEARAFHVANELDIFSTLDGKELASAEMAKLLGLEQRPIRMLMDVCVALKLLEKSAGKYSNSLISSEFLVKGKPNYSGNFVSLEAESYRAWAELGDAVRRNRPSHRSMLNDEDSLKFFTHAMHSTSVFSGSLLAQVVDLSGYNNLLDVGGGAGVNAIKFAERYENLHATVFDRRAAVEVAAEYISQSPAAERIATMAGDFKEGLPEGHDAALLSNILHGEGPESNRELTRHVYETLDAPGIVIISDLLPNEERTGPPFSLMFALNELIYTDGGDTYTESEIEGFLENAGFEEMNTIRFEPTPLGIITGLKKI